MNSIPKITIKVPVGLRNRGNIIQWSYVSFTSSTGGSDDAHGYFDVSPMNHKDFQVRFSFLKSSLKQFLRTRGTPIPEELNRACPHIAFGSTDVKLGAHNDTSWDLAYLLYCLASANIGHWNSALEYWASGCFEERGYSLTVGLLPAKTVYVRGSMKTNEYFFIGRHIAASNSSAPGMVCVGSLYDLFTSELSPLKLDYPHLKPEYFNKSGPPGCLNQEQWTHPTTFQTHQPVAEILSEKLRDRTLKLVKIIAPPGMGKTTVLTKALQEAHQPSYVVDLTDCDTMQKLVECLRIGISGSTGMEAMTSTDQNPEAAVQQLATKLLPQFTWVVLLNSMVNTNWTPTTDTHRLVSLLAVGDCRCVLELWDPLTWDIAERRNWGAYSQTIDAGNDWKLCDAEWQQWLAHSGITEKNAVEAFASLEGHPLGISALIKSLSNGAATPQRVTELASRWVDSAIKPYVERLLKLRNEERMPQDLVQWFSVFWPQPLPNVLAQQHNNWLLDARKLGLVSDGEDAYRAQGCLHIYSTNRLLEEGRELSLSSKQLPPLSATEYDRMKRSVAEILRRAADKPVLKDSLANLFKSIPMPPYGDDSEMYTAPVACTDTAALLELRQDMPDLIWALEQFCRNQEFETAQQLWADVLESRRRQTLIDTISNNWISLRSLTRAYYIASRNFRTTTDQSQEIATTLKEIKLAGDGHQFYAARLALIVAENLALEGQTESAGEAVEFAERLAEALPDCPTWDYRFNNKCQLQYFVAKAHYSLCTSQDEARKRLSEIGAVIYRARNCAYDAQSWLYRRAWALKELIDLSAPCNWGERLSDFEYAEFQGPLGELVLSRAERLMHSADHDPDETVASALVTAASGYWRRWLNRSNNDPVKKQTAVTAIICGLVCRPGTQNDAAQYCIAPLKCLTERPDQVPQYSREDIARLLQMALVWSSTREGSSELKNILAKIQRKHIDRLAGEIPSESRWRLWSQYLRFQIRLSREQYKAISNIPLRKLDTEESIHNRQNWQAIKNKERAFNNLFSALVDRYPVRASSILAQQFGFATEVWQRRLRWLRLEAPPTDDGPYPDSQKEIIDRLEKCAPHHPATALCKAKFYRYLWQHEEAYACANKAYNRSRSALHRQESSLVLIDLLTMRAFTPAILQTQYSSPLATKSDLVRLEALVTQLADLWPDFSFLAVLRAGQNANARTWETVVEKIERRLPYDTDYWQEACDRALLPDAGDEVIGTALEDITESRAMLLLARPLMWAAEEAKVDAGLRVRLAEASFRCAWAGYEWERSFADRNPLDTTYLLGASMLIALKQRNGAPLFGVGQSPFTSKSNRRLTWPQAAASRFDRLKSLAIGKFRRHAKEVHARLQPARKQYDQGSRL